MVFFRRGRSFNLNAIPETEPYAEILQPNDARTTDTGYEVPIDMGEIQSGEVVSSVERDNKDVNDNRTSSYQGLNKSEM